MLHVGNRDQNLELKIGISDEKIYPVMILLLRAVNPPCHQILRVDRKEIIDDVISHHK